MTRTLDVEGDAKRRIRIADDAVQWRVRWECDAGAFAVAADDARLGSSKCSGKGKAEGRGRGAIVLSVATEGRWRMTVEQQVTTPLNEAPLPALSAKRTRVVKRGRFRPIERRGAGQATMHRLADGRLVLRLSGFSTAANTDLAVWLSTVRAPRTTTAVLDGPHRKVANLKATIGAQNYVLPPDVAPADVRSIVIWCEPVRIAYTAATLKR
ncbi:MAG: DM13 domain-containing protein [Actinomycetota bacterium]|nr:DM13 domain-containing protein [Actinomycetota bacterium]